MLEIPSKICYHEKIASKKSHIENPMQILDEDLS
jgi:hypothetical protein